MPPFQIKTPKNDEFDAFYEGYIQAASEKDVWDLLENQPAHLNQLFDSVDQAETIVPHHPYTWTLRQVLGHLIDVERTFSFRMMHVAVGFQKEGSNQVEPAEDLVGMDQDQYVNQFRYTEISTPTLLKEFDLNRQSNLLMIQRFHPEFLDRSCIISGCHVTVRALIFMLVGHVRYHQKIMAKRLNRRFE